MSKSASENYLDQLLNSVHDSDDHVQEAQKPLDPQEKLERDILGEPESKAQVTAKKEEEFLREFEEELLKDDLQEPFSDYEPKMVQEPEDVPTDTNLEVDTGDDLDFNFDLPLEQDQKEQPVDQLDQAVDAFDDKVQQEAVSAAEQTLPLTEAGEPDLAGNADSDLLDMLNNSEDLSDLGDLLNGDEQGKNLDQEDSIGAFAQTQMDEQEQATDPETTPAEADVESVSGLKKKKKERKSTEGEKRRRHFCPSCKILFRRTGRRKHYGNYGHFRCRCCDGTDRRKSDDSRRTGTGRSERDIQERKKEKREEEKRTEAKETKAKETAKAEERKETEGSRQYTATSESSGNCDCSHDWIAFWTCAAWHPYFGISVGYQSGETMSGAGQLCRRL